MTEPRLKFVNCLDSTGLHRMAYWEWAGPHADAPVLVCVHGLSRQGRDFDALARALSARWRVVCPDVVGRGHSDWLRQPAGYQIPSYIADMVALLARLDVAQVDWVGTSMGGLIGLGLAALPRPEGVPSLIRRLVLNDVGPKIPRAALARIKDYIGKAQDFADLAALTHHLRVIHRPFGDLSAAQWGHLAEHSARTLPNGRIALHYDPAIATPIQASEPADVDMTALWQRIAIPRLAIRGEASDLLLPETLAQMAADGASTHEVADAGHAPALMDLPTIAVIQDFLRTP
jgi:pimeloyl-ACP methyl ester carboxylesterase